MPTATAPARIQSPALSSVTPPVGISFTCGNGARTSLMYCGPSMVAGKTFTMSAPASCAARISVGEKQPGMAGTPRSWQAPMTSGRKTGPTTNVAPASMTARAVATSVTVPAPRRNPSGSVGASARIISTARGTVIVTSSARTPPSASASTTARSFAGSFNRITATTPNCSIRCAIDARPRRGSGRAPLTVCILRIVIGIRAVLPAASAATRRSCRLLPRTRASPRAECPAAGCSDSSPCRSRRWWDRCWGWRIPRG